MASSSARGCTIALQHLSFDSFVLPEWSMHLHCLIPDSGCKGQVSISLLTAAETAASSSRHAVNSIVLTKDETADKRANSGARSAC